MGSRAVCRLAAADAGHGLRSAPAPTGEVSIIAGPSLAAAVIRRALCPTGMEQATAILPSSRRTCPELAGMRAAVLLAACLLAAGTKWQARSLKAKWLNTTVVWRRRAAESHHSEDAASDTKDGRRCKQAITRDSAQCRHNHAGRGPHDRRRRRAQGAPAVRQSPHRTVLDRAKAAASIDVITMLKESYTVKHLADVASSQRR